VSTEPTSCIVCGKEAEPSKADLCPAHARAFDNVKQAFTVWTTAYGSLSPSDFLKRVGKLAGTGKNAKEVVEFLERNPARWR